MHKITPCLLLAAILGGCNAQTTAPPSEKLPPITAQTHVAIAAADMVLAQLPATVVQPPGARVAVATPFAGLVRSVHVQPGQVVR